MKNEESVFIKINVIFIVYIMKFHNINWLLCLITVYVYKYIVI